MSFPSIRMRSAARLARIIGLLSLAVALSACTAVKLGYDSLTQLGYWWLDGYADFDDMQGSAVRDDLARIHAWHRVNELPRYVQLLQQFERLAPGDITAAQACAFEPELRARADALRRRAEPALIAHAMTLQPRQLQHLEHKFQDRSRDYQKEWVRLAPDELVDKRLKEFAKRAEIVYGPLDDSQRALLREMLQKSVYSPAKVAAESRRRQQDIVLTLRGVSDKPVGIPEARAAIHGLLDRALVPPDPAHRAYLESMRHETCGIIATLHNSMRPAQREHAAQRLRDWQRDLRELSGVG
jgi:hypothetical protein